MAKWFVQRNGKQAGPFETVQLRQLATEGKIRPEDLIRREDQSSWAKASDVKGLIAAPSAPPPASMASTITNEPSSTTPPSLPTNTPPVLPNETPSFAITEAQINLSKALLYATVGSLVILSFCSRTFLYDEEGVPIITLSFSLGLLITPISMLADTGLLFISWNLLPASSRPMKLHPAVIVATTFLPFLGYIAYFFAYGLLGAAWWKAGTITDPTLAENKSLKSIRWMGFLLAGWLAFMWIMHWLTEISTIADFDLSWWDTPIGEGKRRAKFLERWLTPAGLATIFLALWYWSFYYSQIFIWNSLKAKNKENSAISTL